jgi:ubiquinone biosynthesis accessory factor UbiJ
MPCSPRVAAYNVRMLQFAMAFLAPAALERLTLALNHVLGSEPAAQGRLRPHVGRVIALQLTQWPAWLPAPPRLVWRVTPAGLLEWCGPPTDGAGSAPNPELARHPELAADLSVHLMASNPAALLAGLMMGQQPQVQIEGDAQLAADVNWLLHNLRWDMAADLERLFGPVVAQQLHQVGSAVAAAMQAAWKVAAPLAERFGGPGIGAGAGSRSSSGFGPGSGGNAGP